MTIALGLFALLAALGIACPAAADGPDDILIVANKSVQENALSLDEVRLIFLKKRRVWASGQDIVVLHDQSTTALRHRFGAEVLGMTVGDEMRYWRDEAVRSSLKAPKEIETKGHERLRAVFSKKGAISYVLRRDYVKDVVKILAVVGAKAP
jgi:hypothetical protein